MLNLLLYPPPILILGQPLYYFSTETIFFICYFCFLQRAMLQRLNVGIIHIVMSENIEAYLSVYIAK